MECNESEIFKDEIKSCLKSGDEHRGSIVLLRSRCSGSRLAYLIYEAAKELIQEMSPARVVRLTEEEIEAAIKSERPMIIKSGEDASRVNKCMRSLIRKRYESKEDRGTMRPPEGTEAIPTWSLCYLINGDKTGLTEGEIQMIEEAMKAHSILEVVTNSGQPYFTTCPLFGKPTDVEDCKVYYR